MSGQLKNTIEKTFEFNLNSNQLKDLERLIFEISRIEKITQDDVLNYLKNTVDTSRYTGRNKFFVLKKSLISRRFPLTSNCQKIDTKDVFLTKIRKPLTDNYKVKKEFIPERIYVEKAALKNKLLEDFTKKFPSCPVEKIDRLSSYLKKNPFGISELKKPVVFIVKEWGDFIKPCPCTKLHISCGYWIFNLGFGCPYDCSYCFLQQYSNFPGITLPANIEDFFEKFDIFLSKLKRPIRIGTGEFCDSLALDHITQYSKQLIPYFKDKNVLFELKTKSNQINNLLKLKPPENIIISWSLNPQSLIDTEEIAAATLKERLESAKILKGHGYKIAFHFDPIIYSRDWEKLYKDVVTKLYENVKSPLSWISLGTLRSNRQLKAVNEARFPKSDIFYSELFLGEDKKLRYPKFLRTQIYKNMIKWIRKEDKKTPVYLCMESKDIWKALGDFGSTKKIESYLINS